MTHNTCDGEGFVLAYSMKKWALFVHETVSFADIRRVGCLPSSNLSNICMYKSQKKNTRHVTRNARALCSYVDALRTVHSDGGTHTLSTNNFCIRVSHDPSNLSLLILLPPLQCCSKFVLQNMRMHVKVVLRQSCFHCLLS